MTSTENPRTIDITLELAGTPEEVWDAIATGPGISSWLQPTELEEHEGGRFTFELNSGPKEGRVTAWEPARRLVQETDWGPLRGGGETAHLATEWLIEARSGGTSVLRMVMSGFGTGADWDAEIDGMSDGMSAGLAALAIYIEQGEAQRAIRALLAERDEGFRARDTGRFTSGYAANAVNFEMAPPLSVVGASETEITAWFERWDGAIERETHAQRVTAQTDIAFVHHLTHIGGQMGGERHDLWFRETLGLRRIEGDWYIVHEHTSVPFAMDGDPIAQLDLAP